MWYKENTMMNSKNKYLKKCEDTSNIVLVVHKHNISPKTIYGCTYVAKKRDPH